MSSKPIYADQKHYWRRGFVRGLACGIILMLVLFFALAFAEHALGQNTDESLGEELKTILQNQILPEGYDKLPYLSYTSLSGALWAYKEMPKPTYIIAKKMFFSLTGKDQDGKWVTLYRVYFTPRPGTTYNVPEGKTVRYERTISGSAWGTGIGYGYLQARTEYQEIFNGPCFDGYSCVK